MDDSRDAVPLPPPQVQVAEMHGQPFAYVVEPATAAAAEAAALAEFIALQAAGGTLKREAESASDYSDEDD